MSAEQYEIGAATLRRYVEDNRVETLDETALKAILSEALEVEMLAHSINLGVATINAERLTEGIIEQLDLLRPVLLAYWSNK